MGTEDEKAVLKPTGAQHTPGPWTASMQRSRCGKYLGWIVEHSNGRIGWSSYATAVPNEGEGPPYEIGGANARLIAAAPELLEALTWALTKLPLPAARSRDNTTRYAYCEMHDKARAALAKATGQATSTDTTVKS